MRIAKRVLFPVVLALACTACPGSKSVPTKTPVSSGSSTTPSPETTTFSTTSAAGSSTTGGTVASTAPAPTTTAAGTTVAPGTTTTVKATTTPAPTTTVAPVPNPCAGVDFRNRTYDLPDWGVINVVAGQGIRATPADSNYLALQVRDVAVGDIGGPSTAAETAVFTNANTGGTGQFTDVHIFTCSGATVTRLASAGVGDRADDGVRALSMTVGRVVIDRFTDPAGACCPMAALRQGYTLAGSGLVAAGPAAKRKFMTLDADPGTAEVPISFLPGTSGALLFGDTATSRPGGLNATAGQNFTLAVEPSPPGLANAIVELWSGAAMVASAASGATTTVTLPTTGHYQVRARPATAGTDAGFDVEITIV